MATNNSNEQIRNISIQDRQAQNTAADWARQLRFSNDVNMSTVGVDTDRVTPDLLMATSKKLLGISRGQQQGDAKDSLRYQKVYGPVEYFAQHVQRDGGSVARSLLWKATNKGNLDFIGSGSLQPHVSSVFNESNLTRFIDNSTPFEGIDASMLLTRVGQGGINSDQSAPIQMRLVQPSYYGYVGGVRTQDKSPGITAYLSKNVMKGTDGKLYQKFYNPRTGREQLVDSQKAASSVVTTNQYMNTKDKYVYALGGDKGVRIVSRSSVDYILPRADEAWSTAANVVPMMSGVKSLRLNMGCLHPQTPVPFVDQQGFTDLVPAKRLGSYGDTYLYGCDQTGHEKLYKLDGVYSRFPDFNRAFKRVITASGRVLVTSPDHKWYVYQGGKYQKITADKLQQGMLIPRSTFFKLPTRLTTIFGVTITKEICVLIGRLLKSYEETPKTRRFTYVVNETVNQQPDIIQALKQLNIIGSNFYQREDIHYVSISDVRLIDWIETEMKSKEAQRKIPKAILSLPKGMTSYVLDSYCKQRENVGQDIFGDIWLLDIPSPIMRDGLSLMLGKIFTDTYYRDSYKNGKQYRALKLIESENQGNVYLEPIKKILDEPAPAFMVDLDCDDHVYAVGNGIITHNSKYISQAVALQKPEAPLVRSLDEASGKDMDTLIGKFVGAQFSPKPGIVQAVRKDRIDMLYDDGTKGSVGLYDNFPANAKGWLSNYPMVKAGQRVGGGELLAKSNYTDDKGVAAMGRNLHIGYMSYHGGTYEDACTISQSAAKKMAYTTMYKTGMDTDKSIRSSKTLYNAWKPGEYTKEQMQKLDDKGVVKVGQVLHKGDPMILGIRTNEPSPGTMGKRILTDVSQVWDHAHQGVVTDVVRTRDGIKVYAKVSAPLQVGDKISGRWGNKGTIAQIIPDDKMPRDEKGVPLDVLMDPLGIVSRCYDQQTEFLTHDGWQKGSTIDKIQEILTYFPQSDTCRFTRQEDYMYSTNYTGTMYKVDNKDVSFCVTKNHTVFFRTDKQFKTVPVQDIYKEHIWLPTGQNWVQVKPEDWSDIYVYQQKVYCPTVNTGFVVTRRADKIVALGNTNPSQLIQAGLGKLALKTGKPIVVPQFMPKGQSRLQWAKQLLKKNNISMHQTVFDPDTNKNVSNVFTGYMYFLPLKHIADTKMSARGTDTYTAEGIPAGGGEQGCFPAAQNILTIHGQRSIATLCEKHIPQYVLSWDKKSSQWCYKQIKDWFTYKARVTDILNIKTDGALSICGNKRTKHTCCSYPTKNHKMYMYDGSVKLAGQLCVGDRLAGIGTAYTQDQRRALLGTLMGDACGHSSDMSIQCCHSSKQINYLNYKLSIFAAIGAVRSKGQYEVISNIKKRTGTVDFVKSTAAWLHIPRSTYTQDALQLTTDKTNHRRHLTNQILSLMGQFGFCIWFLDDGSMHNRIKHKGNPSPQARIATHSFSVAEVKQAAYWLQTNLLHTKNSVSITIYKGLYKQDQPCLNFRKDASWAIAKLIAKHIPWEVIPASKVWLKNYCKEVQQVTPCIQHDFKSPLARIPIRIKDIKPYKHDKADVQWVNVYDFTVEDTHNYCLSGGINVSNSKRIGGLQVAGLVGHNAFDFLTTDAKLIRGQSNAQFWRSLRTGEVPVIPGQPLVHKKFFAHLQGSGMHIRKTPKGISVMALTNKDVNQLAGNRELKSKDTYQQKTFREIDGGLFGKDIFGADGNKWGYIQLDEPLPNPVMQQPLARLLRMSDQQFQNVVSGKQEVNGLKNSSDIQKALSKIDLKAQRVNALKQLKEASASKRDAALKRYVAIARMQDNGTQPSDYMLDKIPVLPPEFRPITTQGNLTMVADSNYLYAQLLDARDDQRQAKTLTPELQNEARGNIYKRWKQLVGLYDPQSKKLQSKSVKGLLRWALGTTPKFGGFQRKVLGSTVDTVGRGVVVPDSKLKLNQIGLPQAIAWNIYSPFISRKLVQAGYTPVDALKLTKEKNVRAKDALMQAMQEHPTVMNRAPSLHKLSLMGFQPVLTTGYAIKVNPSIVSPFGMDFDGDTVNIHVPVSKAAIKQVRNNMFPQRNLISARKHKILYAPQKAFMQGLYVATRMGDSSKGVKTFHSIQQAKQAYKNNQIDIDTPIVISK